MPEVGLDAGRPILQAAGELMGFVSFFDNFIQIFVLLIAWLVVLVAFFLLAVQLFVTLIEFKITTLAGFVLIPFGLFSKTSFLAEKVLGNVVASGVKVLVLAVIVGIGTGLFGEFTRGFGEAQPTIEDALALVLAALSLLGLGLFGPGIATGLVSGAPQLGAGAAAGTALAAGRPRRRRRHGDGRDGHGRGPAERGRRPLTGTLAVDRQIARRAELGRQIRTAGRRRRRVPPGGGGGPPTPPTRPPPSGPAGRAPSWAQRLQHSEAARHGVSAAVHTIRSSDHGGGSASCAARRGGSPMNPFRRSSVRYGRTPEPETPYQKAAQLWDERIGSARVQARNWRLMAFGGLMLAGGLGAGSLWQAARGTVVPWVVEVDRLGQTQAVAPAVAGYRPTDPADRLASRPLHRRRARASGRSGRGAAGLAARLRLRHRPRRRRAQRLCPRERPFGKVGRQQVAVECRA